MEAGGAAAAAGVQDGDILVAIDGTSTQGMTVRDVVGWHGRARGRRLPAPAIGSLASCPRAW
jgi:C-terminal processing protease CtpA/Prc